MEKFKKRKRKEKKEISSSVLIKKRPWEKEREEQTLEVSST